MKTGAKGRALIQSFEQCRLVAYPDPGTGGAPWTIGWGRTKNVKRGDTCTQEQADAWFEEELVEKERDLRFLLGDAPTTQDQFDALMSFEYNVGSDIDDDTVAEGLGDSTLLRKHKAGDYAGAALEFEKWNKAGGRVMAGLTRRRKAERELYEGRA